MSCPSWASTVKYNCENIRDSTAEHQRYDRQPEADDSQRIEETSGQREAHTAYSRHPLEPPSAKENEHTLQGLFGQAEMNEMRAICDIGRARVREGDTTRAPRASEEVECRRAPASNFQVSEKYSVASEYHPAQKLMCPSRQQHREPLRVGRLERGWSAKIDGPRAHTYLKRSHNASQVAWYRGQRCCSTLGVRCISLPQDLEYRRKKLTETMFDGPLNGSVPRMELSAVVRTAKHAQSGPWTQVGAI
ncbi:hypothetical protein B0H19DRAFT_1074548 [Mycena capillaripes]|nr:hypothetical protein B0H19DRAFT_1074548 [Mycena capillaripes]